MPILRNPNIAYATTYFWISLDPNLAVHVADRAFFPQP